MSTLTADKKAASGKITKQNFPVLEMKCAACAVSVESRLKATPDVKDAAVNFANQTATVAFNENETTATDLQNAVRSIGYDLVVDAEDPQAVHEEAQHRHVEKLKQRTVWS